MAEQQALKVEPQMELKFKGPFEKGAMAPLKLSNPTSERIAFKIKTTAPMSYDVKPSDGILDPGASISIPVIYHPCGFEPPSKKHKFLVKALHIPDGEMDLEDVWKNVETSQIMETKLVCSFEVPSDSDDQNLNDLKAIQEEECRPLTGRSTDEYMDGAMKSMSDEDNHGGDSVMSRGGQVQAEDVGLMEEVYRLERGIMGREANERSMLELPPEHPYLLFLAAVIFIALSYLAGRYCSKYI